MLEKQHINRYLFDFALYVLVRKFQLIQGQDLIFENNKIQRQKYKFKWWDQSYIPACEQKQ